MIMKKLITIVSLVAVFAASSSTVFASNGETTAMPSRTKFMLDGKEISFDMSYNIEDSNYIQLRSVAQALSGTKSQFNVYWDVVLSQAVIETGKAYTGVAPDSSTPTIDNKYVPLEFVSASRDTWGLSLYTLKVKNVLANELDAFTLTVICTDAYGNNVYNFDGTNYTEFQCSANIKAGETRSYEISLWEYPTVAKITVYVSKYKPINGDTVEISELQANENGGKKVFSW